MKISTLVGLATVLGILLGTGLTAYEFYGVREAFDIDRDSAATSVQPRNASDPAATPNPPATGQVTVVNGAEFDFGVMDKDAKLSHEFILRNESDLPVTLKEHHKTCQCTDLTISKPVLEPGETCQVTLGWKPKTYSPVFLQRVEIEVKGGRPPLIILTVKGRVQQNLQPVPEILLVGSITNSQDYDTSVSVFAFQNEHLKLQPPRFDDASTADFYEISTTPLTSDDLTQEPGAKSGQIINLKLKQGMPLGPIKQTLFFPTNEPNGAVLNLPINGKVVSDVSINGGARYNPTTSLLTLGTVPSATGTKEKLQVYVRGEHRDKVTFTAAEIDPSDALKVTIGEPQKLKGVVVFPLQIEVPPKSPQVVRLGSKTGPHGKVVLNTTHPLVKQLRFFVEFAITD